MMKSDVIKRVADQSVLLPEGVRMYWAQLACSRCGAPVGREAAGSTECMDCIFGNSAQ